MGPRASVSRGGGELSLSCRLRTGSTAATLSATYLGGPCLQDARVQRQSSADATPQVVDSTVCLRLVRGSQRCGPRAPSRSKCSQTDN